MMRRAALPASLTLALLAASLPARADNASLAEALFREAREAMRAGHYASACPQLAESQRLDPSSGTRLNLAICEEHEGRVATAWAHFRAVVDELPSTDPRAALAREHAKALEPRLPWLRIVLPAGASGVTVAVDGTPLSNAGVGVELPVDPGPHAVDARAPHRQGRTSLDLVEGEHRSAVIALIETPVSPARPVAQPRAQSSARRTAGWATVTTGAAGVVTSLILGALVLQKESVVTTHCPGKVCDPTGLTAARDGTALETAATASFAIGLAALGIGASLVVGAPVSSRAGASAPWSVGLQGTF
jgi:hypothetical protein